MSFPTEPEHERMKAGATTGRVGPGTRRSEEET